MIYFNKALIALTLIFITSLTFAEVPVVDDSENYALLEEQAINTQSSVHNSNNSGSYYEPDTALAHENPDQVTISNNAGNSDEIRNLKQELQELRGQVEVLNHELKKLKEQQLTFYKDLDARISNKQTTNLSENSLGASPDPTNDPNAQQPIQASKFAEKQSLSLNSTTNPAYASPNTGPADEQISYLKAYELIKNKRFPEAVTAMQNFIVKYPSGAYSANAEYWLGELYLAERNYPNAISHFDSVLQKYPTSNKYPASLLKLGYAFAGSGNYVQAKSKLNEVMQKYPGTNTAELARNKLVEINSKI